MQLNALNVVCISLIPKINPSNYPEIKQSDSTNGWLDTKTEKQGIILLPTLDYDSKQKGIVNIGLMYIFNR